VHGEESDEHNEDEGVALEDDGGKGYYYYYYYFFFFFFYFFFFEKARSGVRAKEWMYGYFVVDRNDDRFRVCQVAYRRKLANGELKDIPCSTRVKYLTGAKNIRTPSSLKDHLMKKHAFSGKGILQQQLVQDNIGNVKVDAPPSNGLCRIRVQRKLFCQSQSGVQLMRLLQKKN
jgi:hypothetical protein